MQIRDAVERDAPAMARLGEAPESVLRDLVHDRTVRVLVDGEDDESIHGFVSFDAREEAVHVTEFGGDREGYERLLGEPLRFAEREGLPVEMLLGDADDAMREAAEAVGFTKSGPGPRFRGETTRRYRFEPS